MPASGRIGLSTLDEVVGSFQISSTGVISLLDYFEPFEYISMDAADADLGSSGVCLLDGSVFKGGDVKRIALTVGKNSKVYVMNADNLGGFKTGPNGGDNVLQTIVSPNSVFGGIGSYPLEGGYFYFTPNGYPIYAYKLGFDGRGAPNFALAGQTSDVSTGRVGNGVPTITTFKGQPGTGIVSDQLYFFRVRVNMVQ